MRHPFVRILTVFLATSLIAPAANAAQIESAPVVYTVIDLGSLAHPDQDKCLDSARSATINDIGIGNRGIGSLYYEGERAVAAVLSSNEPRTMVSGEGGGRAYAINASGQIAGVSFAELPSEPCGEPGEPTPVTWNEDFRLTPLELPDNVTNGAALAINSSGIIAGWVDTDQGRRATVWLEDGPIVIGHTMIEGATNLQSEASAINDAGLAAGTVRWTEGDVERSRGFIWDGANARFLDPQIGSDGSANAINNAGVVAGYAVNDRGVRVPTLWWRGQVVELGPLSDRPHAVATDLNNAGFTVGFGEREDGLTRAMIWISGAPFDLNEIIPEESGWQLQMAVGINDDGVIAGWGDLDGERRAFLLAPAAG